ncbi:MAG: DUF6504 family protein [Dehalococcoidia bacterium]
MAEFIGREIEVTTAGEIKTPVAFRLGGQEYEIAEVVDAWQDHGFGLAEPLRKNWRLRHHRTYYRVRTSGGEVFEIYMERGSLRHPERRRWYVYRRL